MLYLVSTPIGNLSDITYRAVEILTACDLILCEDTRHSAHLLQHYNIKKPLRSFHMHNEQKACESLIEELREGKTICLISDAGTPLISDPGFPLVQACVDADIPVIPLPGACACIDALVGSGLPATRFQFVGFLPQKKTDLARTVTEMLAYPGTSICYESPHRLLETLELLAALAPARKACVARELTKKFETFQRGTAAELYSHYKENEPKGEIVLLIAEDPQFQSQIEADPLKYAQQLENIFGIPKKESIKIAAEMLNLNKRSLYKNSIA